MSLRISYWSNRLIAIICVIGALSALGLAGRSYVSQRLKSELEQRLDRAQIKYHWARLDFKWGELCAQQVRLESKDRAWSGETDELCVPMTLKSKRPFIAAQSIEISQLKVWLRGKDEEFDLRSSRNLSQSHTNQSPTLEVHIFKATQQWNMLWNKLKRLGERTIKVKDLSVYLSFPNTPQQVLFTQGVFTLNSTQGDLILPSDQVGGVLGGAHPEKDVQLRFTPQAITLANSARLRLTQTMRGWVSRYGLPNEWTYDLEMSASSGVKFAPQPELLLIIRPLKNSLLQSSQSQQFDLLSSVEFSLKPSSQSKELRQVWNAQITAPAPLFNRTQEHINLKATVDLNQSNYVEQLSHQPPTLTLTQVKTTSLFSAFNRLGDPNPQGLSQLKGVISGVIQPQVTMSSIRSRAGDQFVLPDLKQLPSLSFRLHIEHGEIQLKSLPPFQLPSMLLKGKLKPKVSSKVSSLRSLSHLNLTWQNTQITLEPNSTEPAQLYGQLDLDVNLNQAGFQMINRFSLSLDLQPLSCQRAYQLVPQELLGSIHGAHLTGQLDSKLNLTYQNPLLIPKSLPQSSVTSKKSVPQPATSVEQDFVKLTLKRFQRRCHFAELKLQLNPQPQVTRGGHTVQLNDVDWLNHPFTYTINSKWTSGKTVRVGPETPDYVPLSELPGYLGGAMYLTEETGFWRGGALSLALVNRAINTNLKQGKFAYGGSTITQQLVKNLFLDREKTLVRKFREALIAARMIDSVSKRRVLELYLNMIEFGPNIFGVQSAARFYFQKDARALSPEESIFLAMLKVSPLRGTSWVKRGSSPTFTWWRQRSVQVFERLVTEGLLSEKRAKGAAPFVLRWSKGRYLGSQPLQDSL